MVLRGDVGHVGEKNRQVNGKGLSGNGGIVNVSHNILVGFIEEGLETFRLGLRIIV